MNNNYIQTNKSGTFAVDGGLGGQGPGPASREGHVRRGARASLRPHVIRKVACASGDYYYYYYYYYYYDYVLLLLFVLLLYAGTWQHD